MLYVKNEQKLLGHVGRVWCVLWSPEGNILASCGEDRNIRLWRKQDDGTWVCTECISTHHKRTLRRLRWSRCGEVLAVCSFDGTVSLWSRSGGGDNARGGDDNYEGRGEWRVVVTLEGHENEVKSVGWSADREWFASCSRDKSVWIWKANEDSLDYECASILTSHSQDVKLVAWHPVVMTLYSGSYDSSLHSYQVDADDEWFTASSLMPHTGTVWGLCFDKDGCRAVSCAEDGGVKMWRCADDTRSVMALDQWQCIGDFSHSRPVYDVSWSMVDNLIASGCGDNHVRIYEEDGGGGDDGGGGGGTDRNGEQGGVGEGLKGGWRVALEIAHPMDINSVSWNPITSMCLASAGDDESVVVWTLARAS